MKKPKVITAWAIINGASGFIYQHDFRSTLSIYADEEEAKAAADPREDEQVLEVEICILPSRKSAKPHRKPKA